MPPRADKARRRAEREAARAAVATQEASPGKAPPPSRRPWAAAAVAALLLAAFAAQALVAARSDSVTIDEYAHLPMGWHQWTTGDYRPDPINPPWGRMALAVPLAADPPAFEAVAEPNVWGLGARFLQDNAARYQQLFVAARSGAVALSLGAAVVMGLWALELYGVGAALAALALFAFSPSLLAHGHLVNVDMAGTLGFLLALYANHRFLARPTAGNAAILGAAVAVANLLKLSGATLVAMIAVTWVVRMATERKDAPRPLDWLRFGAAAALAFLAALNAGYGFDGTFDRLADATLAPGGRLARLAEAAPWLRLPLPRPFLDGVDMVLEVGKVREPQYFLAGEWSAEGWWYYHLAAFAMKCPLPVLGAGLAAVAAWLAGRSPARRDYGVFVPLLLLFAANSAFNSLDIGERHVLSAYPLVFIAASPWIASALASAPWLNAIREVGVVAGGTAQMAEAAGPSRVASAGQAASAWVPFVVAVALLAWTAAGTLSVAPRYLEYFNEAAGGPSGGHRMLVDSNIDWGQDLLRLRRYMDDHGLEQVSLAYFGRVDPGVYGIRFTPLERGVSRGKAVVSASFLMGRPYFWYLGGRMRWVPWGTYAWLQGYKPVDRVGSMFVFDLD